MGVFKNAGPFLIFSKFSKVIKAEFSAHTQAMQLTELGIKY
jgi:hypothetical protein